MAAGLVVAMAIGGWARAAVDEPATEKPKPQQNAAKPMRDGVVGLWQGTLEVGVKLRVVFHINADDDGKLTGTLDSPDQGAKGIKIDKVEFTDGALRLSIKTIAGAFEGKLDESTGKIAGKWSQGGASLPLVLETVDKPPELHRPQEPKKPYPYDEEEVTYENAAAGVKLAGTLTLPRGGGPFAAVLLITGSGAQDRDESLLGHKPFLVLADYLTRRGIAVLRVDDRGVGGSTGNLNEATTEDLAGDALAGVALLKSRKDIDPRRIGLVGHSEGGLIAPLAAIRSDDVAFIVLIAGPGMTGEEILYAQGALIGRASGATDDAVAMQRKIQERMFAVVKQIERAQQEKPAEKPDIAAVEKQLADILAEATAALPEEQKKAAGDAPTVAQAQIKQILTPWFRYFLVYDPRPTLAKVRCPVLAVIGERDLQVPPKENLPEIEKALTGGGNKDFTLRELPGLNHLLQPCKTGSPAESGQIEETMSPAALELIGDWIVKRAGSK